MTPDQELLRRYVDARDEAAFADLVRRHLTLVHTTALRLGNGDAAMAEDVTQTVFTDLARKADTLRHHATVAGWLHVSARYAAAKAIRSEQRRRTHEQEASAMNEQTVEDHDSAWAQMRPLLDDAVSRLHDAERDAVLLRFFQGKNYREIGGVLGVSEDAARMRVERALDKLRGQFARRGVTATVAFIGSVLGAQAATKMPVGMAAAVATQSLKAVKGSLGGIGLHKASTKILAILAGTVAAAAVVTFVADAEKAARPWEVQLVAKSEYGNAANPGVTLSAPASDPQILAPAAVTATAAASVVAATVEQAAAINGDVPAPKIPDASSLAETVSPKAQGNGPEAPNSPDTSASGDPAKIESPPIYTVVKLDTPLGDSSETKAINNLGQIVGWMGNSDATTHHAFLSSQGNVLDLGTGGRESSEALAINNAGAIVGKTDSSKDINGGEALTLRLKSQLHYLEQAGDNVNARAFLYDHGKMQDLGTAGGLASWATGINDSGQVTGMLTVNVTSCNPPRLAFDEYWETHAFLYRQGRLQDLGPSMDQAWGINAGGMIAGGTRVMLNGQIAGTQLQPEGGFGLWQRVEKNGYQAAGADGNFLRVAGRANPGMAQQIDTLWGRYSMAYAVNKSGQIVGMMLTSKFVKNARGNLSSVGTPDRHAFLYSEKAGILDLGAMDGKLSYARGINSRGEIVGAVVDQGRAFLYQNGKMQDLNLLVGEAALTAAGFKRLDYASGINDAGQIVGWGTDLAGHQRAFLLTPVGDPSH